jgi:tRNA dimethylallyltransferase
MFCAGFGKMYDFVTILGPTACGKTRLAVALAGRLGTGVISADSRQVYRRMDIGTGKDLDDYVLPDGRRIPVYLTDIAEPGYKYNVYEYQRDFLAVYKQMKQRGETPVVCGGSGMYIEAVLKGYRLISVPVNNELRRSLEGKTLTELTEILSRYKTLHNTSDVDTIKRAVRGIEIEEYYATHLATDDEFPKLKSLVVGVSVDRDVRRKRISQRLQTRLKQGMVEEVRGLLNEGVSPEDLIYYGLEYKYITQHLMGDTSYDEMVHGLETAIHQFAKRQMTWFRGMEKRGTPIRWVDGNRTIDENTDQVMEWLAEEE